MGHEIAATADLPTSAFRLVGGSAEDLDADGLRAALTEKAPRLIVDFSAPAGNAVLLAALRALQPTRERPPAVLIGTTGLAEDRLAAWRELTRANGLTTLIAPNTSVGVLILSHLAREAAAVLSPLGYDIEITETHHKHKKDAPSGTAKFLAKAVVDGAPSLRPTEHRDGARQAHELGMHAVRGGGVFGEHEVRFLGEAEEVRLSHRAFSRALFASGALVLGGWLVRQAPGLHALADVKLQDLRLKP
jgi:4-hydroxy-tetrahydrodipicolinate reductase